MPEGELQEDIAVSPPQNLVQRARGMYYGWWLAIAGSFIGVFASLSQYSATVFFLPISEEMKLSRARMSLAFSAARLEGSIEGPLVGYLNDKLGPRPMLLFGLAMAGGGFILLAMLAHGYWSLFLIWVFILSLGFQAGFFSALTPAMNIWFVRRRTTAISFLSSANRVGGFIWAPVLAYIVVQHGWRTAAVVAGILILVITLPLSLLFRRSPESMGLHPDGDKGPADAVPSGPRSRASEAATSTLGGFTVKQALKTGAFWQFVAASLFQGTSMAAISVHMIPILVWKGVGQQSAANIFAIVPLIGIPMTLVYGQLGDRFKPWRVLGLATLVSTIGLAFLVFGKGVWPLYAFVVLHGLGESASALGIATSGEFFGRKRFATIRGIQNALSSPIGFAAPIFAGWVYDQTGSYLGVLLPVFFLRLVSVPLYLFLRKPEQPVSPAHSASSTV
ncbi:MAG: MFS transporter [Dehalococcoidia bacterium]|nr:MFS transporter [Dehalococcoidia bacterium]